MEFKSVKIYRTWPASEDFIRAMPLDFVEHSINILQEIECKYAGLIESLSKLENSKTLELRDRLLKEFWHLQSIALNLTALNRDALKF